MRTLFVALFGIHCSLAAGLQSSLFFEPNQGQLASEAKFLARHGRHTLLTDNGAISVLDGEDVIRMRLVGSRGASSVTGADPKPGRSNYLDVTKAKNIVNVPHFGRVVLHEVYPSIDLAFFANDAILEYDFLLKPGADPAAIQLEFSGARPRIASNGDLVLKTRSGELRQHKPVVYQIVESGRVEITSRYKLRRNWVSFELASFDRSRELVIDPPVTYMTFLGGTGRDAITAIKVDGAGNSYVIGLGTTGMPQLNPAKPARWSLPAGSEPNALTSGS